MLQLENLSCLPVGSKWKLADSFVLISYYKQGMLNLENFLSFSYQSDVYESDINQQYLEVEVTLPI